MSIYIYKIVVPIFGAAYAAPNTGTTILYLFKSPSTVLSPTENSKIQGLFKLLGDFPVLFKADLFLRTFQESPLNSSTFQACANSGMWPNSKLT